MKGRVKKYLNGHPHPNPPPSRGRELMEVSDAVYRGILELNIL
jgi:hypothetical protein